MKRLWLVVVLVVSSLVFSGCTVLDSKVKSGLQVTITNNEAVSLFLNGEYIDKTPLINKSIKPGEYLLRLQPDNPALAAYETPITLRKGLLTVVTWEVKETPEASGGVIYELEPLSNDSETEVVFSTVPDGVILTFDNQEKQFSPLSLKNVEPGHHEFEASLPSYQIQKHTINVLKGHRLHVDVKLAQETTKATAPTPTPLVASPSDVTDPAEITIDEASLSASLHASTSSLTGPRVKISSTQYFVEGKEVLRVRQEPSNTSQTLGFVETGTQYPFLQQTQNGWYKISFNGQQGWVSSSLTELIR